MDNLDDELRNLYHEVGKAMLEEDRKSLRIKLQQMVEVFSSAPPEDRESAEFRQGVRDLAIVEMFSGEAVQLLLEIERERRGQALTEQEALQILSKILQDKADSPH
jgi:sporulation-control protein spo0M